MTIANLLKLDDTGVTVADYEAILADLTGTFKSIYGADAQIGPETQDGQLLAAFALAVRDAGDMAAKVYNNMNPLTATGDAFDRWLTLQGLERKMPTQSAINIVVIVTEAVMMAGVSLGPVQLAEPNNPGVVWQWDGVMPPGSRTTNKDWIGYGGGTYATNVVAYATTFGPVRPTVAKGNLMRVITPKTGLSQVLSGVLTTYPAAYVDPVLAALGNDLESVEAAKIRRNEVVRHSRHVHRRLAGGVAAQHSRRARGARVRKHTRHRERRHADSDDADGGALHSLSHSLAVYNGALRPVLQHRGRRSRRQSTQRKAPDAGSRRVSENTTQGMPIALNGAKFLMAQPVPLRVDIAVSQGKSYSTVLEGLITTAVTKYVGEVSLGPDCVPARHNLRREGCHCCAWWRLEGEQCHVLRRRLDAGERPMGRTEVLLRLSNGNRHV